MFLMCAVSFFAWASDMSFNILKQNIASERCAIIRYEEIASYTNGLDFTTCDIAKRIMTEEEEHEQELQDYLRDVEWIMQSVACKC